jgi:50S ribosome-binding GTPase
MDLGQQTRALLNQTITAFSDDERTSSLLRGHLDRMDAPLRVAIAGKVKAGKSTLLNALVGEDVAATDAGECTKVVTWYQDGRGPAIAMELDGGETRSLPVIRRHGALLIDLDGMPSGLVRRLVVDWPSSSLRATTLIDTPGIVSANTEVSERTTAFLCPEDDQATADAVVYLMPHLHPEDLRFLEAFHDNKVATATPVNTIAVLSRADEVGGGEIGALQSARAIAYRYSCDEKLRGLCQLVVPVAGLLAQTGRTLRQHEFTAIQELATAPRDDVESALLSVDRFIRFPAGSPPRAAYTDRARSLLLARFGLFGLRLGVALVRQGCDDPGALAAELVRRSGLDHLREVLTTQFTERSELLKARSALMAVGTLLADDRFAKATWLRTEVERIMAGAHEFAELNALAFLRNGALPLPGEVRIEAERLLGGQGVSPLARLGLGAGASAHDCRDAGLNALTRWRLRAESPLSARAEVEVARVVVRSCEGLVARSPR